AADLLLLRVEDRTARLNGTAEVDTAVGDAGEARLAVRHAVVADERAAARDVSLLGVGDERGHDVLALGEVLDRAEVDILVPRLEARGQHGEAERGQRGDRADERAEAQRGGFEEDAAGEALGGLRLRHRRRTLVRSKRPSGGRRAVRLDGNRRPLSAARGDDVTRPEKPEAPPDRRPPGPT